MSIIHAQAQKEKMVFLPLSLLCMGSLCLARAIGQQEDAPRHHDGLDAHANGIARWIVRLQMLKS